MEILQMSPRRPHLLRAFYNWLIENQLTPHIVVDVTCPGVIVPMNFAHDGQIVLNIAPQAVGNLELSHDGIFFDASFDGISHQIIVPIASILAIYARENGTGTMFEPEPAYDFNRRVDDAKSSDQITSIGLTIVDNPQSDADNEQSSDDDSPPPRGGRPTLRVVK